jgi:hypothetical protein
MEKLKRLPEPDLKTLFPPNLDYNYFEDCQRHPFRYDSQQFELVNAWWLADAALLAYAELDFVRERFMKAGLPKVELFEGAGTQCYVAHNDSFAIVSFRGTQVRGKLIGRFLDILTDLSDFRGIESEIGASGDQIQHRDRHPADGRCRDQTGRLIRPEMVEGFDRHQRGRSDRVRELEIPEAGRGRP